MTHCPVVADFCMMSTRLPNLPDEVLDKISDLVEGLWVHTLGLVCRKLRQLVLLRHQFVPLFRDRTNNWPSTLRTLHCTTYKTPMLAKETETFVKSLRNAPNLNRLHLDLHHNNLGDNYNKKSIFMPGAMALGELAEIVPMLTILDLDLSYNNLGDDGFAALAAFKNIQGLHTLRLNLHLTNATNTGASALGALYEAQNLCTLCINLTLNGITDPMALAAFKDAAELRTLHLNLSRNPIKDEAKNALLQALKENEKLQNLTLTFGSDPHFQPLIGQEKPCCGEWSDLFRYLMTRDQYLANSAVEYCLKNWAEKEKQEKIERQPKRARLQDPCESLVLNSQA